MSELAKCNFNPALSEKPSRVGLLSVALLRWIALLLICVVGGGIPSVVTNDFYLTIGINGILFGLLALAIAFLIHQCGFALFGMSAYYGGAAYLFAIASLHFQWNIVGCALFGLFGVTAGAIVVGALVVRAKPLAFAMLTLAIGQMFRQTVTITEFRSVFGGEDGLITPFQGTFFGMTQAELATPHSFWPIAWFSACLAALVFWYAKNSHFGYVLRGIKQNEERMRFSGYNTYLPRLAAFVLAGLSCAWAGVLQVLNSGFVSPELLDFHLAGDVMIAALVGGVGTIIGPLLGGLLFVIGQDQFGAGGHLELYTGIAVVAVLAALPQGIIGGLHLLMRREGRARPTGASDADR